MTSSARTIGACSSLVAIISTLLASGQGASRLQFETQDPGTYFYTRQYWEGGFWFRSQMQDPQAVFAVLGDNCPGYPRNFSAYLQVPGVSLIFSVAGYYNISPFNVHSVDLAEYSALFARPTVVRFIGYRTDGTIITNEFVTDGIIHGEGPIADFQTFTFGPEWTHLGQVLVEVPEVGYCLDNLVVSIPEFRITEVVRNGDEVNLSWSGGSGIYQILSTTNLANPVWENVGVPTTNNTATVTITKPAEFFRVQNLFLP